jgi:hypothetical protein
MVDTYRNFENVIGRGVDYVDWGMYDEVTQRRDEKRCLTLNKLLWEMRKLGKK